VPVTPILDDFEANEAFNDDMDEIIYEEVINRMFKVSRQVIILFFRK
jgi:hypothetical protein